MMMIFSKHKKTGWQLLLRVMVMITGMQGVVSAQEQNIKANEFQWATSAGADVRWFDWREHIDGKQILMETGPLAAVAGQLLLQYGHVYSLVDVQWGGGLAHYNGHASRPNEIVMHKYEADAWEEIVDSEWRLGWQEPSARVYMGLMQRDWRRFIEGNNIAGVDGVSSAEERYRWKLLTLGGEYQMDLALPWDMAVAASVGMPLDSYQKVYANTYDGAVLEPGKGLYWRIALPLRTRGSNANFSIEPYYQQQSMAESNSVPQMQKGVFKNRFVYQPASIRRELGVGVRWQFAGNTRPTY